VKKIDIKSFLFIVLIFLFSLLTSCAQESKPLVVFAGKGLKHALDEIKTNFEKKENIPVLIIYAGSQTLLTTIKKTGKGDVFIPGSASYIEQAGDLVTSSEYLAMHIPTFAISPKNSKKLVEYTDLVNSDVRIGIGNRKLTAIGKTTQNILERSAPDQNFSSNIVVSASTSNQLIQLLLNEELDAALVWKDLLNLESANDLGEISIPKSINVTKEIRVSTLSTSRNQSGAKRFLEFVTTEGRAVFTNHGFSQ
jgi:molybdate transport system substrate-binding protein